MRERSIPPSLSALAAYCYASQLCVPCRPISSRSFSSWGWWARPPLRHWSEICSYQGAPSAGPTHQHSETRARQSKITLKRNRDHKQYSNWIKRWIPIWSRLWGQLHISCVTSGWSRTKAAVRETEACDCLYVCSTCHFSLACIRSVCLILGTKKTKQKTNMALNRLKTLTWDCVPVLPPPTSPWTWVSLKPGSVCLSLPLLTTWNHCGIIVTAPHHRFTWSHAARGQKVLQLYHTRYVHWHKKTWRLQNIEIKYSTHTLYPRQDVFFYVIGLVWQFALHFLVGTNEETESTFTFVVEIWS